jgi:hypothetical protein
VITSRSQEEGFVPVPQLFPNELRPTLPPLGSQEGIRDPVVYVRIFNSSGVIWYVTEGSPDDDDFVFFGFVVGPDEEWGEFSLSELTDCARSGVPIARDVHFTPERLSHAIEKRLNPRRK